VHEADPLTARRSRALCEIVELARSTRTLDERLGLVAQALVGVAEVPFASCYVRGESTARLVAHAGVGDAVRGDGWPFDGADARVLVTDVQRRLPGLGAGPDRAPIEHAYVLAVPACIVVAGVNPHVALDDDHRGFYTLLWAALASATSSATAGDADRARRELDQEKAAFFANVSHEFRTPLTLILAPIEDELAERAEPLPPGRYARLATAHRNSRRLLRMVNTLLDVSDIDASKMQTAFEPLDLVAITEDLATNFRPAVEKAGLRLSFRLEALPEPIYVDREMWAKIVLNLLSNALKHTFRGGITVSLYASDESTDHVELRVDDTGIGIPEKELPRLFQRFHRVRGARARSQEGTGVGLALVRTLVTLHGGEVGVVSREGLGSSFRVRLRRGSSHLPAARIVATPRASNHDRHVTGYLEEALRWTKQGAEPIDDGPNLELGPSDEAPVAAGPRPRVLWADNNPDMRSYGARLLAKSYDVLAVADGDAALQAALDQPPDLVVADAMLPGRDGLALLRELRASERTCLIPVILLSARAGEEATLEGLDAGADDYLVKPFSGKALLARVRSCLELARLRKESADKLTEANRALATAAAAKASFLASMSHEIRTPMNAVIGMTGLLLDTRLDETQQEFVETIRTSGEHLLGLINDILDYSKIEAGKMELDRAPFDVRVCVEEALDLVTTQAFNKNIELIYEAKLKHGIRLLGDVSRLRQIVVNLLSNAVKFTESGEVAVTIADTGGARPSGAPIEIEVSVRDSGIGMTPEQCGRLFQAFTQADAGTTRRYGGTGLGLAICKKLVEAMGGTIGVTSEPGKGSVFRFTFRADVVEEPGDSRRPGDIRGLRVLVVDDNTTNRQILRSLMTSWGADVWDTDSPAAALRKLDEDSGFELALVDFNMPEMDGLALARKIRARRDTGRLAIAILSSGGVSSEDAEQAKTIVQGVLRKPIKQSQLHDAIANILSGRRASAVQPRKQPSQPPVELRPVRILLAEDNPVNQRVAQLLLQKLGQRIDIVGNGLEAVHALERQHYDVVFMDCEMPELDGFSAARTIRATTPPDHQPYIIAMTANAMEGDRERCLAAGMNDYVAKPIRAEVVAEALQRGLDAKHKRDTTPPAGLFDRGALETLLEMLDAEMVGEIVETYLEATPPLLDQLRAAISAADGALVKRYAHDLKSTSGAVGAAECARIAAEMEAHAEAATNADLAGQLAQLSAAYEGVRPVLAGFTRPSAR
jgi:signal transduction histidine kinase/HPt (histidine-containing phosphotransfer) domain-containing protein